MIVPAGYVPVIDIHFWFAREFNKKWDTMKGSLSPWIRKLPERLKAVDDGFNGEARGAIRRSLLQRGLREKAKNLYLCRPDLTVVVAGRYILETYESPSTKQPNLLFLDSEYKHIGAPEFFEKYLGEYLGFDMNDEEWQAAIESMRENERLTPPNFGYWGGDSLPKLAEFCARITQLSPEFSNIQSPDESLTLWKRALWGVMGGLSGTHLVVTDADAKTIQDALSEKLDSLFLKVSKGAMDEIIAALNAAALELKINRPGASTPGVSLVDRIIEEIKKAKGARKPVKKLEIMDKLCKVTGVTEVKFNDAWKKVASMPDYKFISKPGPKPKMSK